MCLAQKLDIKMVFWTLLISLAILASISILCFVESCSQRKKAEDNGPNLQINVVSGHLLIVMTIFLILSIFAVTAFFSVIYELYPLLVLHAYFFVLLSIIMISVGLNLSKQNRDYEGKNGVFYKTSGDLEKLLKRPEWFSFNQSILYSLQAEFGCCGVYGWQDYWRPLKRAKLNISKNYAEWLSRTKVSPEVAKQLWLSEKDLLPLPKTCCHNQTIICMPMVNSSRQDGCIKKVALYSTARFIKYHIIFIVFGISVALDAGLLFIFAGEAKQHYYFYPYFL